MKKLRWLKPQLVAEVRFTEWTSYGLLRHATFAGLRDDKEPAEVTREQFRCVQPTETFVLEWLPAGV
jgi:bifunctional non-homologous end joining protein LigD